MKKLYLIGYDISKNTTRYAIYRKLLKYRVSGQKSFFECLLNEQELRDVIEFISILIDYKTDKVHIFQLNKAHKIELYGIADTFNNDFWVI